MIVHCFISITPLARSKIFYVNIPSALRSAAALGFGRAEIVATIQAMQREHFYKSITAYADHRLWQDVYYVPSPVGVLYVKFTADVINEFLLLSFKGKDNG